MTIGMTVHSMVEGRTHEHHKYRWVVGSARLHEANRDDVNYVRDPILVDIAAYLLTERSEPRPYGN